MYVKKNLGRNVSTKLYSFSDHVDGRGFPIYNFKWQTKVENLELFRQNIIYCLAPLCTCTAHAIYRPTQQSHDSCTDRPLFHTIFFFKLNLKSNNQRMRKP